MQTTTNDSPKQLSAIDRALAAARARAAAKASLAVQDDETPVETKAKKPAKEPKVKEEPKAAKSRKDAANKELTDQQRDAARQKREEERASRAASKGEKAKAEAAEKAAKKAAREAAKAEKRAAKEAEKASKKPAHMKKVARAAGKLPPISSAASATLDEITTNLSRNDIAALALHLQHFNRMKATEMSTGRRFKAGQRVRIVAGDLANIGKVGTIESARPLRVFVNVPGAKKPVYVFTSEVELVEEAANKATGTEG